VTAQLSQKPRFIVFLGTAHDNGGTSILANNLAAAMRKHGHRVEEWYLFDSDADLPQGARVFSRTKRSTLALLLELRRVVAALRREQPDVLIGLQPLSNLVLGLAGRIAGIRNRVSAYHGPRWSANQKLMNLDTLFSRLGFYTQMVACGKNVADTFKASSNAYANVAVVVNGQNVPRTYPRAEARAALGLPADGVILGQIGRLSPQKNQGFSLELMRDLPRALLVLVGIGPDEAAVRAQISAAGISERVRIIPAIANERIGLFYSAVDLVLFPSRFEGLSLAAIEAIHAGVPALCSDIPSFLEMFAGSPLLTAKLLLPLSDPSAWLKRIDDVMMNQDLRQQIVAELARLSPRYGFDTMAEQYLRLIDQRGPQPQKPLGGPIQSRL
jgi:glycosyltransferase involved in cell wall biosynthesis